MGGFESFFLDASVEMPHLHGVYNPGLVLLSILVSIFSATMALQTVQIASKADSRLYRNVAISTGAIALGGGIWTMHFIGMLAFELPAHVHYAPGLTVLSILPACAASWFALRMLANTEVAALQLAMSGTLVGLGIGAMHYSGMAAMQTSLQMRYEPVTFVLSIAVAVGLAVLSLWVRYGLRRTRLSPMQRLLAGGAVMGLAISGMHYTGMAAVRFFGEPGASDTGLALNATFASLVLSTFTVTVTVLVVALNGWIRSHELHRQMEESQSRLRAILDTAVDGIITIDSRGRVQSFSQSAERLFGWTAAEVIGRNIKMLMPEPDRSRHDGYLHNYHTSGIPKIIGTGREVMGLRKDGSLMPMRLAVGRVDLPDELLFVGFVSDITDRHALEASLRETAQRAEQAAAAKSTFLANMSHEIRTPMNSIVGFTELLLQRNLAPTERNHLNTIRESSRSLLRLINDILDTTKMEKGSVALESIDFSLKGLAMQIESSLRPGAQAKDLALAVRYPADMPEHFQGDPLRVLQVLTNLVGNAIKFTERGRVELVFAYTEGVVHVQVRDTGIGMTAEQVESIFTPFTQADASISRRFGGTGLGTTIARQLVELMGGRIEVESESGRGSTFHVRLPLPLGQAPAAPVSEVRHEPLPPLDILIADDVPQNLELLALTLGERGHRVVSARDGDKAVEKFMAGRFDVVLMDVHMPGTDGLQATRLIRQYERTRNRVPTPIIALTASVMTEDRHAAHQAGMDGFAVKPLDLPRLFDEIAQVLNIDRPANAPAGQGRTDNAPLSLIDWSAGISLWGSEARLAKAIDHFLNGTAQLPLPDDMGTDSSWEAVLFSLHGLRGAAGNLALPAVAELAGTLEDRLRKGEREQVAPRLSELRDLLGATARELSLSGALALAATADARTVSLTDGELLARMHELLACLARSELDDAALDAVCAGLESQGEDAQAKALRIKVESFEFIRAHALLQRLIASRTTQAQA